MSELRPRSELRTRSTGSADGRTGIARHGRLRKSRPILVILKFVAAALAVALVSGASIGAVAFNSVYAQRDVVQLVTETEGPLPQIGAIEGGFNILIVGSDRRAGQNGIGGTEEDESSDLNDVNILLHVSQDQTNATAISFPRDLVVGIPECVDEEGDTKGYSTEALNTAMFYGGLPCVVQTISNLTGLPIQFAGEITFQGVIAMSDAIGGVDVCVNAPIYDEYTGLNIPTAGVHNLKGEFALQFLRSRHGVGDGSDLTRISSQQVYLSSLVRTLKSSDTLGDYKKLYDLANAALGSMTLSSSLADVPTMVSVALALKDIPLERVTFVQYPGSTGGSGIYAGKVQPRTETAAALMAVIAADQPFLLAAAGDGRGSEVDPNAPVAAPDPESTATPIDNTGLPVIDGVSGQTTADYTCSIAN